jgi:CubicO group peptidase (beta-lactamase class C family)
MWQTVRAISKLAVIGILVTTGADGTSAAGWSVHKSARVEALVAHFLRPRRLDATPPPPSLSLAIGVGGELVLAKGYGDAGAGRRATERTVYSIGSISKQFTAAAVLHLIEDGALAPLSGARLGLDTQMREIFSDVDAWTAADEPPITVRSLLNMTSNLPNFTRRPPANVDPWGAVAAPQLLSALKKLAPSGWPHSFEYSNTSYFLLAEIAERATDTRRTGGESFRDLVRGEILARAGMTATGFAGEEAAGVELARPEYRRRPAFAQPDWLKGSADMTSNALDLFAWNKALMERKVIGPESLHAMFGEGGRVGPMSYYGMGWFVDHEDGWDKYRHSGTVPGYTSLNAIFSPREAPTWISITLLTNADGIEGLDALAEDLFELARSK